MRFSQYFQFFIFGFCTVSRTRRSKTQRSGLVFPVSRIQNKLMQGKFWADSQYIFPPLFTASVNRWLRSCYSKRCSSLFDGRSWISGVRCLHSGIDRMLERKRPTNHASAYFAWCETRCRAGWIHERRYIPGWRSVPNCAIDRIFFSVSLTLRIYLIFDDISFVRFNVIET